MKKSIVAASSLAFVAASAAAILPARAITYWGPSSPTSITNYRDNSSTVPGDFAVARVGVFGGGVTSFINSNKGPFINYAEVDCNTGNNTQTLAGTNTFNANVTVACPWFGNTLHGLGSIESD